jgi:CPA2 family monovalent cation:H+ antiporter-2/glutathione-regulated potassium-efflux system protein KefB
VTLIDTDIEMIDVAGRFGAKVYFGDGTRLDLLRQAGAAEAELICFCIDGEQLTPELIEAVHQAFPKAALFARAYDRRAVIRLKPTPVRFVVRELIESAVKMGRAALTELGTSEEAIDRAETMFRNRDKERLRIQIETGEISAAREKMIVQPERAAR